MKFHAAKTLWVLVLVLQVVGFQVARSEPHAVCSDGGDPTPSPPKPTMTPPPTSATPVPTTTTTTTPTPTTTTATPIPTLSPVDCKLFSESDDPGAFDGNCTEDPATKLWYERKFLSEQTPASNGGAPCTPTQVTKQCPPINCAVVDTFGACTLTEREISKAVTRTVVTAAKYGGSACPAFKSNVPCETEYFCDPLTNATEKAVCVAALQKSTALEIGGFYDPGKFRSVTLPNVWSCINECVAESTCIQYTYYFYNNKCEVVMDEVAGGASGWLPLKDFFLASGILLRALP